MLAREPWTRRDVALLLGVTMFPLLAYSRIWLAPSSELAHFFGDTTGSYWPDLAFFTRSVSQGDLPLWNPHDRGGYPFAFDPQTGVLYPPNWLLVGGAVLGGGTPYWLLQLKVLLHLMAAAAAWYCWLRARHTSWAGAAVGAMAGSLGVYTLQQVHFSLIWPLPFVPLALWAVDSLVERPGRASALSLGAALGGLVAAGSPPTAWYGLLVIASYGVSAVMRHSGELRARWRRFALYLGLAAAVTCALALPVLWGASLLTDQSVLQERTFRYMASGSIRPAALPHFLLHRRWGHLPLYAGVSVVLLAAAGLLARRPSRISLWAVTLGLLGLLLALGDSTPVLGWLSTALPPMRLFRGPARYVFLVQVGLAVLAAAGTDALVGTQRAARPARWALMALAAYLVIASTTQAALREVFWQKGAELIVFWTLLIGVCAALARGRSPVAAGLAILIVGLDLSSATLAAGAMRKGAFAVNPHVSATTTARLVGNSTRERVWDEFGLGFRSGSRLGVRDLRGYMDPLMLRRYSDMVRAMKRNPNLLARFNVHWVLDAPHPYAGTSHNYVRPRLLRSAKRLEPHVLSLEDPRPVAVWVDQVRLVENEKLIWAQLTRDPTQRNALVLREDVPEDARASLRLLVGSGIPKSQPAEVQLFTNNRLELTVNAPSPGLLVVNEAWFPFWDVSVGGAHVENFPVDGWVRGVPVPAGQHRVQMSFRPTAWLISAAIAMGTWVGLGALGASWLYRRRRSGSTDGGPDTQAPLASPARS